MSEGNPDWDGKEFVKEGEMKDGFGGPFGCCRLRAGDGLERGFAACTKCGKRHLVATDCEGEDFVCGDCLNPGKKFEVDGKELDDDGLVTLQIRFRSLSAMERYLESLGGGARAVDALDREAQTNRQFIASNRKDEGSRLVVKRIETTTTEM